MYVNNYLKLIKNSNIYAVDYSSEKVEVLSIKNSRNPSDTKETYRPLPQITIFKEFYIFSGNPIERPSSSGSRGFSIYAGTGATLPSVEDIDLEAWVDLKFIAGSALYDENSGITTITFVRENSTQESITINETCLCVNGYRNYYPVMIARDVLNNPVTLAPGETITITYKIS